MEVHQLRYVVAVSKTGNFSRAAEQCHVSQPTLCQQIKKLEAELGEPLFYRLSRMVKLTPFGEMFLKHAQCILSELEAAKRDANDMSTLARGAVALGVLPTIAPYLLPGVITSFSAVFPGVEVVVHEDTTTRLIEMGADCKLDLLIASQPISDERFETEILFNEELLLVVPVGHRLAQRKRIRWADLQGERFILMREGHCLGNQVLSYCHQRDFHPQVSALSTQIETILALVQAGLGISLVPEMATGFMGARQLLCCSFEEPRPRRSIASLWPRSHPLSQAAKELLKELRAGSQRLLQGSGSAISFRMIKQE